MSLLKGDPGMLSHEVARVLHLEDNQRDAEIVRDRAESGAVALSFAWVRSRQEFEATLTGEAFDLVLCDYSIPGYSGLAALRFVREKRPMTPVIIISGDLSEELAVECLKNGATDYLLKQRLDRLPSAIARAIEERDEHRRLLASEAALRASEERLRLLAEQSSDGFWIAELNPFRFTYVSPALEKMRGIHAARFYENASVWLNLVHPEDLDRVSASFSAFLEVRSARFDEEFRVIRPGSASRWIEATGSYIRNAEGETLAAGGISRDITERKERETHARRDQRLESLGTLAGGVAHDLNNALMPVFVGFDILRKQIPDPPGILDTMQDSARRAKSMVKQLLAFAKGSDADRGCVMPAALIEEVAGFAEHTFPKNINLIVDCDEATPPISGDATELHQVLLNFCVNARDAMPDGGTITIAARRSDIDESGTTRSYATLSVTDTGIGMAPSTLERIFDPFFTTKGLDKGTGLGLSTSAGIVKSYGGFIQVESSPGAGSTFRAHFPIRQRDESHPPEPNVATRFSGRGELVLVVDDEEMVREALSMLLDEMNITVVTASSGAEALVRAAQHRLELRAVLTDLHMPHTDPLELLRGLRSTLPEVPIVVISGNAQGFVAEDGDRPFTMLSKPFSEADLGNLFHRILGDGSRHAQPD